MRRPYGFLNAYGLLGHSRADTFVIEPAAQLYQQAESRLFASQSSYAVSQSRARLDLVSPWRFTKTDGAAPKGGCDVNECRVETDDSSWRVVDLPHDYGIEADPDPAQDMAHGFLPYSMAWYRFRVTPPPEWAAQNISLDFEGVMSNSTVFLNGKRLGTHRSGYTPFSFDVTQDLKLGAPNVIAVHTDPTRPDGWWYDGGGIYRHVYLTAVDPLHIPKYGVYLPTTVKGSSITRTSKGVAKADATLDAYVTVANSDSKARTFTLKALLRGAGTEVAGAQSETTTLEAGETRTLQLQMQAAAVELWSVDSPTLYDVTVAVVEGRDGSIVHSHREKIGFRTIRFDASSGFFLNGEGVKIKGMCNHQDLAGVGNAVPDCLQKYRVTRIKALGSNAWRTAHNPPTPALLDACDELGMLVWLENHRNRVEGEWMEDLRTLILRDRNRPSVVIWSICNELLCEGFDAKAAKILKAEIKRLDPLGNRPVSAAVNMDIFTSEFPQVLDLMGVNYNIYAYSLYRWKNPRQPIMGSETSSAVSDRGVYNTDLAKARVGAYDLDHPFWGATAEDAWCPIATNTWMAGAYVWTGFDYRGEPTPTQWPSISSHFGVLDTAGFEKDNAWYYRSVWSDEPVVHILPHWNWENASAIPVNMKKRNVFFKLRRSLKEGVDVWAYSNGEEVDLLLNGVSLGRQKMPPCRHISWQVPFVPGTLVARAYKKGKEWAVTTRETTDTPARIRLQREWPPGSEGMSANGQDVALISATVVDAQGREVPTAQSSLTFDLQGPGRILGLGNGDPNCHESDLPESDVRGRRSAFNGRAMVLVKTKSTPGTITLQVRSDALQTSQIEMSTTSAGQGGAELMSYGMAAAPQL